MSPILDPVCGWKYKPQAYSLMADFMTLIRRSNSNYTRLRCFDFYKLHSWARGTSEAVNAYYVAALMGLAYGHTHLLAIGSTLTALEILFGTNLKIRNISEMEKQTTLDYLDKKLRIAKLLWERGTCFSRGNYSYVQLQSTDTLIKVILAVKKVELPNLDSTNQVGIVGVY
ncbi:hypothetical protein JHK85_000850 [Glycine max]|uniref:glucan endo-1,3-beta-D-glucosidase n=1 Tax=Glycine max TaxID=3847 RepID=K7K2H6_SOYBN|nr:hypothetical protein JHK87_000831 [Glycine soja]KAG5068473.1 hypothetical protein JHK85_000850 [Glycine max]KAG5088210.1 hypothetical protein JHK86_000822 [Glycine max]KAH1162077.1 hypothetical protein GYH30_000808 [Glycine max]